MGETAGEVATRYGLRPLPVEGGMFRRTWVGAEGEDGRPAGSAIIVLLSTAPGDFSALHRLPVDEVWHFYRGDALELLLLAPDGSDRLVLLGESGEVQYVVPAGTWMGARVVGGGRYGWGLFGTTMAPGFVPRDYEGGDAQELCARYPGRAALIRELCRDEGAGPMPEDVHGVFETPAAPPARRPGGGSDA
ncbi:cupin domain-containing protein [Streptomyces sp. NPDC050703]|uniref:cupin domain-containing protein n=1 Tax=Streptomyces sp. NPDC050703 TaxID=3157218 RepID=UPI0034468DB7